MGRFFRHGRELVFFLLEAALLFLSVYAAAGIRFDFDDFGSIPSLAVKAAVFTMFTLASLHFSGLYDFRLVTGLSLLLRRVVIGFVTGAVLLFGVYWALPDVYLGRGVFAILVAIDIPVYLAWRLIAYRLLGNRLLSTHILILGDGDLARACGQLALDNRRLGYHLVGFVSQEPREVGSPVLNPGVVGGLEDVRSVVVRERIDLLVVALQERRRSLPMHDLLHCKFAGVGVVDGLTFYETHTDKVYVRDLNPSWLIFDRGFRISPTTAPAKRLFDIAFSVCMLLAAGPLILVAAAFVKASSPGGVFYSQVRTGRFGRPFRILKLRTMRAYTPAEAEAVQAASPADSWDPETARITGIGSVLRRTHIDELPQFWNVLRGEMSVVGPRPERPEFIKRLEKEIPYYTQRHFMKPGVTGLAQVMYDYGASIDGSLEKLQYDLSYIRHPSLLGDLLICMRTVRVVLFGRETRH